MVLPLKSNGIILAAGLSSRMNAFKPLLKLQGKTMIEHSIESMFHGGVKQVVVVVGCRADEIKVLLRGKYDSSRLVVIHNPRYAETDMLTSVKIGISVLTPCSTFYLLPGDMPAIKSSTFVAVKEAMSRTNALVAFPTMDGYRKHPPLISWQCISDILAFEGEGGLREIWKQLEKHIVTVPVDDVGCLLDADTKVDYRRLVDYMEVYRF